jgi:hypothetical protein
MGVLLAARLDGCAAVRPGRPWVQTPTLPRSHGLGCQPGVACKTVCQRARVPARALGQLARGAARPELDPSALQPTASLKSWASATCCTDLI